MGVKRDQSAELEQVHAQLAELHAEVARNDGILHKSQERELALLQADDLRALFRTMINKLAKSYALDQVTVVVCDPDHDIRHLLIAGGAQPEDLPRITELMAFVPPRLRANSS